MREQLIGGPIGNWFAIIGVLSLMYWGWRIVALLQHRRARPSPPPTIPHPAPPAASNADDIVVIAAAAQAMLGDQRVVHIEPSVTGQAWSREGRWMQQTSHTPR